MYQIKKKKIIIFLYRLNIFFFAYFLYLIQLLLIVFQLKSLSKKIFCYSSYFASLSLGLSININNLKKIFLNKKGIHIANHDNPLDIFIAQYLFQIPTITTVHKHLEKFLPFFNLSLKNFGHFTFNHLKLSDRKSAYLFLNKCCKQKKSILIFPSGSIYTSINSRFSKSVSNLSTKYDLNVIAWKFYYLDNSDFNVTYNKNIFIYIIQRFLSKKINLNVEKVKVFNPQRYKKPEKFYSDLKKFYSS